MIVNFQEASFIPEQIKKLWAGELNKEIFKKFQDVFFIINQQIILNGYLSNKNDSSKCIQIINGVTNERPDLDNHIEEADMRIIPYIVKSIESGLKNVVVVSNDTDIYVLLLHYTPQFIKSGLTEL